jgi:hypothetical protein
MPRPLPAGFGPVEAVPAQAQAQILAKLTALTDRFAAVVCDTPEIPDYDRGVLRQCIAMYRHKIETAPAAPSFRWCEDAAESCGAIRAQLALIEDRLR